MTSVEQLLADKDKEISKLQEDLAISEQNVKDFESLARTWMHSYNEEVPRLKAKIKNLEQTVESLQEDLDAERLEDL